MPAFTKNLMQLAISASSAKGRSGFMSPANAGINYYRKFVINKLNRTTEGLDGSTITHVYSTRSRVMRPMKGAIAVKLKDGRKGYIKDGRFLEVKTPSKAPAKERASEAIQPAPQTVGSTVVDYPMFKTDLFDFFNYGINVDNVRRLLKSIDSTFPAGLISDKLLDIYDNLPYQERAQFEYALSRIDWDAFWSEIYRSDGSQDIDQATRAYLNLIDLLGNVLGRAIE